MIVNHSQRDALYLAAVETLEGMDELFTALDQGYVAEAQELRLRAEDSMRLLDDLGWWRDDGRESFRLTMPPDQLRRTLRRLSKRAEDDLEVFTDWTRPNKMPSPMTEEEREQWLEEWRERADHDLDVRTACVEALGQMGEVT